MAPYKCYINISIMIKILAAYITVATCVHFPLPKNLMHCLGPTFAGLQECGGVELKDTFPDLGYALLGYNILKGYPHAHGHDPGLTYPIFKADYTKGRHSGDCRYSIPYGVVVAPDVSCTTSFTSREVTNTHELSKSLSVEAEVEGGAFGLSFSASGGFQKASNTLNSGAGVYVHSLAKCHYYSGKIDEMDPPPLDDGFISYAERLATDNQQSSPADVIEFLDYYGTHFLKEVTYGAKYVHEHKLTTSDYKSMKSQGVNVAVHASYEGFFSLGGGFSMNDDQTHAASDFASKAETETFAVGAAPPSNGDALVWASAVQKNPLPVHYKLMTIDSVFTEAYMANVSFDYNRVRDRIVEVLFAGPYCHILLSRGLVKTCDVHLVLEHSRLTEHFHYEAGLGTESGKVCPQKCFSSDQCVAFMYRTNACWLFGGSGVSTSNSDHDTYTSVLPLERIDALPSHQWQLAETAIKGTEESRSTKESLEACIISCREQKACSAIVYCQQVQSHSSPCYPRPENCMLFAASNTKYLRGNSDSTTVFVSTTTGET